MPIEKQNTAYIMLYLCGCVLSGTKPDKEHIADVDIEKLYKLSKFHSLTALILEGLKQAEYIPTEDSQSVYAAFKETSDKAARKNLMLDTERGRLFAFMEQNGIWYMPLKGTVLKDMYPKLGLRQMADNDILFDENYREAVRDWFVEQGYKIKAYKTGNHDVYLKEPIYNFEMHISLYGETHKAEWRAYYENVKDRLLKDDGNNYGYHFSEEDFYIYFIVHGYKHYDGGGNGLRFLLDMYVYLKAKQEIMDFSYIEKELETLCLSDFEKDCRRLVTAIFSDIATFNHSRLTSEQHDMLNFFLSSGTYGTIEQGTKRGIEKHGGRWKYLLWRFFPGTKILSVYHPVFRHKLLLPIGWIYRAVKIIISRPKRVKNEVFVIVKSKRKTK